MKENNCIVKVLLVERSNSQRSRFLRPRIEVDSRTFYFMLLLIFYFAKIASIALIVTEKVELYFRLPAFDCDDRRGRA